MKTIEYPDNAGAEEELTERLFGRSVVSVKMGSDLPGQYGDTAQGEVHLDDGTVLALAGNTGGCSCGGGDYDLTALNDMPINGITSVQVEVEEPDASDYETPTRYRLFVIAQDTRIRLAEFEGDDGSGYYGTGFWISVVPPAVDGSDAGASSVPTAGVGQ